MPETTYSFRDQPIKLRTTTAAAIKRLPRREARKKLADGLEKTVG
jgi:hypothetical protein